MSQTLQSQMKDYGSFKDSKREPIHRWFVYPAGYSYKLVHAKIKEYNLNGDSVILDPFLGSGTTTLASMAVGVHSIGIEAHKFVANMARTKCIRYENHYDDLTNAYKHLQKSITASNASNVDYQFPDLIYKCFDKKNLGNLTMIRDIVFGMAGLERDFFTLALVSTLRHASTAGTGWPYIAPSKYASKKIHVDAIAKFYEQCNIMLNDISTLNRPKSNTKIHIADSMKMSKLVGDDTINLVITSPPYLNNYDYADRTRMETYFLGIYKSWNNISKDVRDKLMISATTQINKIRMNEVFGMPTVKALSPSAHKTLTNAINLMAVKKTEKSGKKNYDMMTTGYFEGIAKTMINAFNVTRKGGHFVLVLGDSAPYGVHVATDTLIAKLGCAAGFKKSNVTVIRKRGDKWKNNPQRHNVKLRESIVVLDK